MNNAKTMISLDTSKTEVSGEITRIFCVKNGWASFLLRDANYDVFSCSGNLTDVVFETQKINLVGRFINNPPYGYQFKFNSMSVVAGSSSDGVLAYLQSGFIKGVGPKRAELIYNMFKGDALNVIAGDYTQLAKVKGITKESALDIHNSYLEGSVFFDLVKLFNGQATQNQIMKIYDMYGSNSVEIVSTNPYKLIYDIKGFGFKLVDALALKSGFDPDSLERVKAAVVYTIKTLSDAGHTYCFADEVESLVTDLFLSGKKKITVDHPIDMTKLSDAVMELVVAGELVPDVINDGKPDMAAILYTKNLYYAETRSVESIKKILKSKSCRMSKKSVESVVEACIKSSPCDYDIKQKEATIGALKNQLYVITGGPGMGKTTIINLVIDSWDDDRHLILIAPTGRAAKRMTEATGHKAFTVHKMLLSLGIGYTSDEKLEGHELTMSHIFDPSFKDVSFNRSLFIVDEASMLDIEMARKILYIVSATNSRVIFVGDIDQLPSIGAGTFFTDLVKSPYIPKTVLEISYRFHGNIAINSKGIKKGNSTKSFTFGSDFQMENPKKEELQKKIIEEYLKCYEKYGIKDTMLLVPMRKSGVTSVNELNRAIREIINPESPTSCKINKFTFRVGDRVMNTSNNYSTLLFDKEMPFALTCGIAAKSRASSFGICNGDCGIITKIDESMGLVEILLDDDYYIYIPFNEVDCCFVLCYAMTIHKAQGSEAKGVIVSLSNSHCYPGGMAQRNLLYTAVTRAKEEVVLVGDEYAFNYAIKNITPTMRNTLLQFRIEMAFSS